MPDGIFTDFIKDGTLFASLSPDRSASTFHSHLLGPGLCGDFVSCSTHQFFFNQNSDFKHKDILILFSKTIKTPSRNKVHIVKGPTRYWLAPRRGELSGLVLKVPLFRHVFSSPARPLCRQEDPLSTVAQHDEQLGVHSIKALTLNNVSPALVFLKEGLRTGYICLFGYRFVTGVLSSKPLCHH